MTAPTHAIFGVLWGAIAGAEQWCMIACALGALLPDIDHPQSSVGRLLFFVSRPLNVKFGHRKLVHSFVVWVPPLIIMTIFGFSVMQWLFLGAVSHIIADTLNVSGVKALYPVNEKTVVTFKRSWRIYTGSVQEIVFCIVIAMLIPCMNYSYAVGGPRKLINALAKSPKITAEEFQRAGLRYCKAGGKFRWSNGQTEEVTWPVVGIEGQDLVYWSGEKLIRLKHGRFLRSTLKQLPEIWPLVKVESGICYVATPSFYYAGKKWRYADAGEVALGSIKTVSGEMPVLQISKPEKKDSS